MFEIVWKRSRALANVEPILGRRPEIEWDQLVERHLDGFISISDEASEEQKRAERRSPLFYLGRLFFEEARRIAKAGDHNPDDLETSETFDEASRVFGDIFFSYRGLRWTDREGLFLEPDKIRRRLSPLYDAWPASLIEAVRKRGRLHVDRGGLEAAVGAYLDSRFRIREVDRALLLSLADMEITAFIAEMEQKDFLLGDSPAGVARVSRGWAFAKSRVMSFVFWSVIAAAGVVATVFIDGTPPWIGPMAVVTSVAGFFLMFILTSLYFVATRKTAAEYREDILGKMNRMASFYSEFRTDGPIALDHFERRLRELADHKVTWPTPIWAILADCKARGLSFV
jgi:hypothetical protein